MEFKLILTELLVKHNLSNADLSRAVNISKARISNFINGVNLPSLNNALKLANYFHCDLDFLFGLKEYSFVSRNKEYEQIKFIKNYKSLLKERNVSNRQLCKELGITKSCLGYWQNGKKPSISTLLKIVNKFNYSLDRLLSF